MTDRLDFARGSLQLRGAMICQHQVHDFMPYLTWNGEALCSQALDALQEAGLNTLLMEYEAMYPWAPPHSIISCKDAYSQERIRLLNLQAAKRNITIIPLVQTLGHVYHILFHRDYADCRELPDQWQQFCPQKPQTIRLVCQLLEDTMRAHPNSPWIHLGGDECRLLGECPKCRDAAKKRSGGKVALYADFYKTITDFVIEHGRIPILWHDMIAMHPELLDMFDRKVLFHFWNYGDHCHGKLEDDFRKLRQFLPANRIICGPAARCESTHGNLLPSMKLCMDNIERMDRLALEQGCLGSILTDWPDSGISFLTAAPLIRWHGQQCQENTEQQLFSSHFSEEFFGIEQPDFILQLNALYGEIPLATGFQTRLTSQLNRYQFSTFDPEEELQQELAAMDARQSYATFYQWCHRRMLCQDAIRTFRAMIPRVSKNILVLKAFMLIAQTMECFLTQIIGTTALSWTTQHRHCVGYQKNTTLIKEDLDRTLTSIPKLKSNWQQLYAPICIPLHLNNFLETLFPQELIPWLKDKINICQQAMSPEE